MSKTSKKKNIEENYTNYKKSPTNKEFEETTIERYVQLYKK